jgi:hypothetical protein
VAGDLQIAAIVATTGRLPPTPDTGLDGDGHRSKAAAGGQREPIDVTVLEDCTSVFCATIAPAAATSSR